VPTQLEKTAAFLKKIGAEGTPSEVAAPAPPAAPPVAPAQTVAQRRLGVSTGSNLGDAGVAGAAALLAGVLTYNMLKKKKGGKVTRMPLRKAAMEDNVDLTGSSPASPAPRKSVVVPKDPSKAGKAMRTAVPAAVAALISGGGGAALGSTLASAPPLDASGGKTWAGKNLGVSTGNDVGDAAVGAGIVGLGAAGLYQLYKKIRGE